MATRKGVTRYVDPRRYHANYTAARNPQLAGNIVLAHPALSLCRKAKKGFRDRHGRPAEAFHTWVEKRQMGATQRRYVGVWRSKTKGQGGVKQGCSVDAAITAYVNKGIRPINAQAISILAALEPHYLLNKAQVVVADGSPSWGVGTQLDIVGTSKTTQNVVVLEIKTTSLTTRQHTRTYNAVPPIQPRTLTGLPNSLSVQHAHQAYAGVRLLQRCTPGMPRATRPGIEGIVVVVDAECIVHLYPLNSALFGNTVVADRCLCNIPPASSNTA